MHGLLQASKFILLSPVLNTGDKKYLLFELEMTNPPPSPRKYRFKPFPGIGRNMNPTDQHMESVLFVELEIPNLFPFTNLESC
jgi:hypothetical protein